MAREDLHFRLRIPEPLKKRIEAAAERNRRSMTAEIVAVLEEAYPAPFSVTDLVQDLKAIVEDMRQHEDLQSFIDLQDVLTDAAAVLANIPRRHKPDTRKELSGKSRAIVDAIGSLTGDKDVMLRAEKDLKLLQEKDRNK